MHSTSPHYRQLQPKDRMTLASLQQQNYSVLAIARVLPRSPSTVSRELSRNADASGYTSPQAQKRCQHRRQSARPQRRLYVGTSLFGVVHHFLFVHWSPEQIALTLARIYPKSHKSRVAHETVYNCIRPACWRAAPGIGHLPAPSPQQTNTTQQRPRQTRPDSRHAQQPCAST